MISSSFLFEGLSCFENLTTLLSKKYNPVIAKSDINFLGFSWILDILLFLILATPNFSGFITLCRIIFEPFSSLTHFKRVFLYH